MKTRILQTWNKTKRTILMTLPLILGVLLLVSLFDLFLQNKWLINLFQQNIFIDSLIGAVIGSLAAGNPITSYVLAGELIKIGISLAAITAFILTWVTVGIVQLPAEIMILGKKFAITRNVLSFISAIVIGLLTQIILK